MLEYVKLRLKEVSTWQGAVAFGAAILMYFTDDHMDEIIMSLLGFLGITAVFKIERKDQ